MSRKITLDLRREYAKKEWRKENLRTLQLPTQLHGELKTLAEKHNVSMTDLIRKLVTVVDAKLVKDIPKRKMWGASTNWLTVEHGVINGLITELSVNEDGSTVPITRAEAMRFLTPPERSFTGTQVEAVLRDLRKNGILRENMYRGTFWFDHHMDAFNYITKRIADEAEFDS